MKKHTDNNQKKKHKIDAIEVSTDCLTSRAFWPRASPT
jgi:hypothetical protein